MIKEGKVGVQEAVCLVVIATSNRVFFTVPTVVAQSVGTAGWYMSLVANIITIIFFTFICLLLKRFPGMDLLGIFDIIFGRFIGFLFSFIYAASFLTATGILLREFFEILKNFVLLKTPISFINGAMIIVIVAATFLGLETIARVAKLAAFFALFGYIVLLILALQSYNPSYLFPILGYGIGKTIIEGVTRSSVYSEVIVLAVIAGSLQGIRHIKKAGYISIILSGLLISLGICCLTMAFSYNDLQELTTPLYILARSIKYGTFFQRLDPAFIFVWLILTTISSTIMFYSALSCYCKAFRLKDRKPVIIPMAVLLFVVTLIPKDLPSVIHEYNEQLRTFPIFLFYILPLAALITSILRKKKGVDNA